jgi:hypothetical protein
MKIIFNKIAYNKMHFSKFNFKENICKPKTKNKEKILKKELAQPQVNLKPSQMKTNLNLTLSKLVKITNRKII